MRSRPTSSTTPLRAGIIGVVVGLVLIATRQVSGASGAVLESTVGAIGAVALVLGLIALAVGLVRLRAGRRVR